MSTYEKCNFGKHDCKGILWFTGLLVICWLIFKLVRSLWRGLYTCFIADLIGATVDWKKLGRWAVVTGSTDGIGKAYAKALAAKGFNIVLISRNQEKLNTVAQEIENKYSVQTKTIAIDVTDEPVIFDEIQKTIEDLEIGVLVNNVGIGYEYAEYLTKIPNVAKFSDSVIKANIVSCTRITLIALPIMERLGKGVILNVSSLTAVSPFPLLSIYCASKVYVNFFSKAAQEEYQGKGIIIQSVLPGIVATNMTKMKQSFAVCTPEDFVKWALKTVGVETQTYGYPVHKLQGYMQELRVSYLPESVNLAINRKIMRSLRKNFYKKYGLNDDEEKNSSKH